MQSQSRYMNIISAVSRKLKGAKSACQSILRNPTYLSKDELVLSCGLQRMEDSASEGVRGGKLRPLPGVDSWILA